MTVHENAFSRGNDQVKALNDPVRWVWEGIIAADAVTLLSAPEKTGKTTLLSLLLDRRREGGTLLGRIVQPGRTILCSEENPRLWALRQPPLDFGPQLEFHEPRNENPTLRGWLRFMDHLYDLADGDDPFDLLVFDSAFHFLPARPNDLRVLRRALNELRLIGSLPAGVLLLHQSCAQRVQTRSGKLLAAFADILIDIQSPAGGRHLRRRDFHGVGRYPGTLQHAAAELNPEGTDYLLLPDGPAERTSVPLLETLRQVLRESSEPLTRQEILARWPHQPPPHPASLSRALEHGCEQGLLARSGEGTKAEAFRYTLAQSQPAA